MSIKTKQEGALEYLVAEEIAVPHCFTTRYGGVSEGYLSSLNIGFHRGDDPGNVAKNVGILADALPFSPEKLVLTHQVHSDIIRCVTAADAMGLDTHTYPESDGLITKEPGVALMIFSADCTPILFYDAGTGAVGAVHAGWRGTASGIAAKCVEKMQEQFGTKPEDLRCAIGPNIGLCCFETDREVPEAMLAALGPEAAAHIRQTGEKFHLDLKAINALWLRRMGVAQIEISDHCTACQCDRFWSHRVTRGQRGSQGAVIVCKEVET